MAKFERKPRDAAFSESSYTTAMIDDDTAWAAFANRDRTADGRFVVGVTSTGIYCRPSCPARRPARANVSFHADPAAAEAAGFRACRRCMPDRVTRDARAVADAIALLAQGPIALDTLAARVGYAPHHFHRLFRRATGVTPAAWARGARARRVAETLIEENNVTDAIYAAGYAAPSRFYDGPARRLGMAPGTVAKGGAGVAIRWTIAATSLGPLLIAATDKGLCRVAFDEDASALAARFPAATITSGGDALAALAAQVIAAVETPGRAAGLPIDVRGTAFQEAVWSALRTIPAGETRSYGELAALAGRPAAVRAVGSACGANPVAVIVPCHRIRRGDGAIGGYAWGPERKAELLAREAQRDRQE